MDTLHKVLFYVKKTIGYDGVVFFVSLLILYGVSYGTLVTNYAHMPADRYYWGNENYPLDQAGNLAHVWEGYYGHWQTFVKFTTTFPDQKTFTKIEYLLLGHFARIFRLDILCIYYVSRSLISLCYLSVIFFVIRKIFSRTDERIIALLLSFFSTNVTIPGLKNEYNRIPIHDILVFSRTTVTTHHYMLSGALVLLSLYCLARLLDHPQKKRWFLLSTVIGFFSSFIFPPNGLLVLSSIPFVVGIKGIGEYRSTRSLRETGRWIGIFIPYSILLSLPALYQPLLRLTFVSGARFMNTMESLNPFRLDLVDYLFGMGASYVLAFFSLLQKKRSTLLLLFIPWLIVHPLGEFILSDLIVMNRVRYFLTPYFVVFGILATFGIRNIAGTIARGRLQLSRIIAGLLTLIVLGSCVYSYKHSQWLLRVRCCMEAPFDYAYPKRDLMEAIWWLKTYTQENDIVLSDPFAGNLIPSFAGNRVYTSWWYRLSGDPGYIATLYALQAFYYGKLSEEMAKDFLVTNKISYVLYSENERSMNGTREDLSYRVLTEVMRRGSTILYAVRY